MQHETKTYFSTKYALTLGIQEVQGTPSPTDKMVAVRPAPRRNSFVTYYWIGNDIFATVKEARAKAEEMRISKIKSLKKSLAKLEALDFHAIKRPK